MVKNAADCDREVQYLIGEVYTMYGQIEADFHKATNLFLKLVNQGCNPTIFYLGALG